MADLLMQFLARGQREVVAALGDVKGGLSDVDTAAAKVDSSTRRAESTFDRMGSTMTRTVTPAAAAAGAAFFRASQDYGEGLTALRAGAGATGQALEDLQASASRLAGQVGADFGGVSLVMADLATRTGASGKALEDLTRQTIQLQELGMGGDVATLTRVFGDWGVAIENSSSAVDALYRASQTTGPSVDRLGQLMVQFGAPLREFGFSMDEAAALLGQFEQQGVNTELVMGALRIALGKFAAAGDDPVESLEGVIEQIQNAGSAAEANTIAFETFGRRAGVDMARAILEGRFNLEELNAALAANSDTVAAAYDETRTFIDQLDMLKDRGMAIIGPFGDVGFAISGVAAAAGPAISGIGRMRDSFRNLGRAGFALRAGGLAAVAIGTGLIIDRLMDARAAADGFAQSFLTGLDVSSPEEQLDALRAQADELAELATSGFDFRIPGTGVRLLPFETDGELVEAFNQLDAVNRQIALLETQIEGAGAASDYAAGAVDRQTTAVAGVASAHDSWVGSLDRLRGREFDVRSAIDQTTEAMNRRLETSRAAVDPVFAASRAQRDLAAAQERLAEVQGSGTSTADDVAAAQDDVARAAFDLEGALGGLRGAQEDGETSAGQFREELARQVEQGRITQETCDAITESLGRLIREAGVASLALAGISGGPTVLPSDARQAIAGAGIVTGGGTASSAGGSFNSVDQSVNINGPVSFGGRAATPVEVQDLADVLSAELDRRRARS